MANQNEPKNNDLYKRLALLFNNKPFEKMLFSPVKIWCVPSLTDLTEKSKYYRDTGERILNYTYLNGPATLLNTSLFSSFESFQQYRIETIQRVISLIERTKQGEIWEPSTSNSVEYITFTIEYPSGKNGDINMFIAEIYGLIKKIGPTTYKAVLSSEHKDELALLRSNYVYSYPIDPTDGLFLFLKNNNLYYKLRTMYIGQDWYYNAHDISQLIIDTTDVYIKNIRRKRNEVYTGLLEAGITSPRWASEYKLYRIVNSLYSDAIYQYRANWLGRQSLDVFIPSLCVGLEYQGIQHYKPINIFGGKEGLENRIELDKKKRLLCKENRVDLIELRYDEPLDVEYIQSKIVRFLDCERNE